MAILSRERVYKVLAIRQIVPVGAQIVERADGRNAAGDWSRPRDGFGNERRTHRE